MPFQIGWVAGTGPSGLAAAGSSFVAAVASSFVEVPHLGLPWDLAASSFAGVAVAAAAAAQASSEASAVGAASASAAVASSGSSPLVLHPFGLALPSEDFDAPVEMAVANAVALDLSLEGVQSDPIFDPCSLLRPGFDQRDFSQVDWEYSWSTSWVGPA